MKAILAAVLFSNTLAQPETDNDWTLINDHELFSIEIPSYMIVAEDLNDQASHQFQYVEEPYYDGAKEIYLITLVETKEEIASYDLDFEFDAMSYWEIAAASLKDGLDSYKILTKNPYVESHNGSKLVRSDAKGKLGKIKVNYHLGVYEGEYAFYQILTWTVADHYEYFKADMEKMVASFIEK